MKYCNSKDVTGIGQGGHQEWEKVVARIRINDLPPLLLGADIQINRFFP